MENFKLFTLVKTQLHNETEIWHFPTLKEAQDKMIELCNEMVGENICALDTSAQNKYWEFVSGTYYATLSNGNKWEFEIFEKEIDTYHIMVNLIAERICEVNIGCRPYIDIIRTQLMSYGRSDLSFGTINDIDHFIDYDFEQHLADAAAEVLMPLSEDAGVHYVCSGYLEGNRGMSIMLGILNNEEETINEVKEDINASQDEPVFKTDFVWVFESNWNEGMNLQKEVNIKVFKEFSNAHAMMEDEYENVVHYIMPQFYHPEDIVSEICNDDTCCKVYDNHVNDMWVGKIYKKYIED